MKIINTLISSVMVPGLVLLMGCSGGPLPAAGTNKDSTVAVTLSRPTGAKAGGVTTSGQVEAVQTAAISTRVMGTITRMYVSVGDRVNKGQVLATISGDDLAAKRAQADARITGARADADNARKDLDRFSTLFSRQSATASELDNATLRYNAAKSMLDAALQARNGSRCLDSLYPPDSSISGVITQKLADEGSLANPGLPCLWSNRTRSCR